MPQSAPQKSAEEGKTRFSLATSEKIRPELTIEKWPAIWRPAKSKSKPEVRTLERRVTPRAGISATAKVEVGFTQLGNLTTEDQKTYYGLVRQWEITGRPPEHTFFSTRKLAKTLRKRWGSNVIDSTTESLRRLRTTPFTWTNSYHNSSTGEEFEILDTFSILADLKIIRRKTDGHITREAGYFRFHDLILKNLLAHHTKPLLFDVILGFKSEIAQLLYIHVDLMLARNDHYERRTKDLFDDLGLRGVAYRHPSNRRQQLERALRELDGVPLSTGALCSATIERTKDDKDYKAVFHKTRHPPAPETSMPEEESRGGEVEGKATSRESPLTLQASELVARFYKLFHGVEKSYGRSKELAQAVTLIANHGFVQARYIVDFSHIAAPRTNYKPQTFGGILQYTSRALAQLEHEERLRTVASQHLTEQAARDREASAARERIEQQLKSLSEAEYQALHEKVKRDLSAQYPHVMAWKKGSLFDSVIRARMARELEDRDEATG